MSAHLEVLLGVLQPLDERVYFGRRRVQVRRHPGRALHAEAFVRRLRAVVPGAYGDAAAVEQLADVVRVHALELEGDRATAQRSVLRAEHGQPGHRREALERVAGDRLLVRTDVVHAERGEVVDGRTEPDRLDDRRGAGLELVRDPGVRRPL